VTHGPIWLFCEPLHKSKERTVQQVQGSSGAFAAILSDGSVIAWDSAEADGDCSTVRAQLKGVQQLQATYQAFAAGCFLSHTFCCENVIGFRTYVYKK